MLLENWLSELTQELTPHFKPAILQRDYVVFQFEFTDGEPFFLQVEVDLFAFFPGKSTEATLTLFLDCHETCRDLLSGKADGMSAFMGGRYRADGNIVLSQLLLYTFKADSPTISYEVQD